MTMRDFTPAFCDDCEVSLGVMIDQHGQPVIACSCPDGTRDLTSDIGAWVSDRAHRPDYASGPDGGA